MLPLIFLKFFPSFMIVSLQPLSLNKILDPEINPEATV